MNNFHITFSKEQKEKVILPNKYIIERLDKVGIDYLLFKNISYVVNDISKLDLTGDHEITLKIKQALEDKGVIYNYYLISFINCK